MFKRLLPLFRFDLSCKSKGLRAECFHVQLSTNQNHCVNILKSKLHLDSFRLTKFVLKLWIILEKGMLVSGKIYTLLKYSKCLVAFKFTYSPKLSFFRKCEISLSNFQKAVDVVMKSCCRLYSDTEAWYSKVEEITVISKILIVITLQSKA